MRGRYGRVGAVRFLYHAHGLKEKGVAVVAHVIDEDTKKIVKAIIHGDQKRQSRKRAGKYTEFDRRAEIAIREAKRELQLSGTDQKARRYIVDKIYKSLLHNMPWELMGETLCCRRLFYEHRTEFCYLVAVNMGIIERAEKEEPTWQQAK